MTVEEMSLAFDVGYDNIAGASAPPIDVYEKSLYLTKAQLEIVKNYYDALSNRKQRGFEGSEKRRVDLKQLIKDYKTSTSFTNSLSIYPTSKFFNIPQDVFLIVNEKAKILNTGCDLNKIIQVKPVNYDEFNKQIDNPFKRPDNSLAWRLDISNINNNKVVEIITPFTNLEYQIRYLKYPKPIILTDLITSFPFENLTIEGLSVITPCELDNEIHQEILDRAIELAFADLRPEKLETKIQIDTRNE